MLIYVLDLFDGGGGGGGAEAPKAPLESATDYDILKVATIFLNFHVFPTFGTDDSGFFFVLL